MPTHVFKPKHVPPSWWDRVLVHPMEVTVGVVAVGFGLILGSSLVWSHYTPSVSMALMPLWVVFLAAAFLLAGGVLAMVGVFYWGDIVSRGWALERFGWMLNAGGFLVYAVSVFYFYPGSTFAWAVPAVLGLGGLLRFWSLHRIERDARQTIAQIKGEVPE